MDNINVFALTYPEAKNVVISGDIHGDFNELVFKLCIQHQMTDTLLVVAGDWALVLKRKSITSRCSDETPNA